MNRVGLTLEALKLRAAAAKAWRLEEEPQIANHGYVLFYRGQPCGWTRDIIDADARKWCPGVLAVGIDGIDGMIFQASSGNDSAGATVWSIAWNPAALVDGGRPVTESGRQRPGAPEVEP